MIEHCACEARCGDVPEEECSPLAVCKGLPDLPRAPLVEIVLVPRSERSVSGDEGGEHE
jgi:hypothetical protein